MARLWSSGFELNTIIDEFTGNANSPSIQTTVVRSGTYALQVTGLTSGQEIGIRKQFASPASDGAFFFRAYFRVATLPTAENAIIGINDNNTFNNSEVYITIDSTGNLRLFDEDGQIGGASFALSLNTWYRIEIGYDRTPAAGSHIVSARIDGDVFAASSSRDLSVGAFSFGVGGNLNDEAQTAGDWFFDDLGINDDTGNFENSFCGEGKIIHLRPNATGDNSDWTNDFTAVDEIDPNDATDFVESNTLDHLDDYNVDEPSAIGFNDIIKLVEIGFRFRGLGASANAAFKARIKASSGGTVEEQSTATAPTSTVWATNSNSSPKLSNLRLYDLPGGSESPWTQNDLNNAQIGLHLTATDTNASDVTAIWMLVEYIEKADLSKIGIQISNPAIKIHDRVSAY